MGHKAYHFCWWCFQTLETKWSYAKNQLMTTHLLFTNPSDPLMQKPRLQEGFVLATSHNSAHVVRRSQDPVRLLREVDAAHRRHVVDVVVPRC